MYRAHGRALVTPSTSKPSRSAPRPASHPGFSARSRDRQTVALEPYFGHAPVLSPRDRGTMSVGPCGRLSGEGLHLRILRLRFGG